MKKTIWVMVACMMLIISCGKDNDESLSKKAGSKVGETLTDFASGMGKGIDKQMTVDVELSQAVTEMGISKTISKSLGLDSSGKGITVYLISEKAIESKLIAKALDKDNMEIGRSTIDISMEDDDAKYATFMFDDEMDTQLVEKYKIDIKK